MTLSDHDVSLGPACGATPRPAFGEPTLSKGEGARSASCAAQATSPFSIRPRAAGASSPLPAEPRLRGEPTAPCGEGREG
jgi:hypothetical protein